MNIPRWLSALLIAALVLSSAPVSVLAASGAPLPQQQAPSVASAPSYLLAVALPVVPVPAGLSGFDAAGYINVQHARHYAEVEARLTRLQEQAAISGFTPLPAAYAFAITGANAEAQVALPQMGQMQARNDLSAASVNELAAAYQRQVGAAVDDATRQGAQAVERQAMPAVQPPEPVAAAAALPSLVAPAVTTPTFQLSLRNNNIDGQSLEANIPVTFKLKSASGAVKAGATVVSDNSGNLNFNLYDIFGNAAPVMPGDVLEVQAPQLITIPVVDLRLTSNMATGELTGIAPANVTSTDSMTKPYLYLSLAPAGLITTTAEGTFAVTSSSPLQAGQFWQLSYANADGHLVHLYGELPLLVLRGIGAMGTARYEDDNFVSGAVAAPKAVVTITLTRAGSPPVVNFVQSDSSGVFRHYLRDVYGNAVDIRAGDTVQATDGVVTLTVVAPTFAVVSDALADTVSGTTDALVVTDTVGLAQTLAIWPASLDSSGYGKAALAPGGVFSAGNPFYTNADPAWGPTVLNWSPGQQGHLRYIDSAGNIVLDNFRSPTLTPILSLRGNNTGYFYENQVFGYVDGVHNQCINGTVALVDAANVTKAHHIVTSCDFGGSTTFMTAFFDIFSNPLPILPGDSVVATFDGHTTTVKAPPLSLSADPATDVVGGSITPGLVVTDTLGQPQSLAVFAALNSGPWKTVLPDGVGTFSANFTGVYDIQPGGEGFARYIDSGGNSVYARWQAPFDKPLLRLRGNGSYADDNYVFVALPQFSCRSDRPLLLAVKTQANALLWQDVLPICGDSIDQYLYDVYGHRIDLQAGDIVEATFDGQTASATVPSFDVHSDAASNTVSGVTSAAVVTTGVDLTQTLVIWPHYPGYGKYATVAAGGAFSVTNPFYWRGDPAYGNYNLDWDVGQEGSLRYIDAAGNHVYDAFVALHDQPLLTIWKNNNAISGYTPAGKAPVTVTVKSGATVKGVGYDTSGLSGYFEVAIYDGAGNPVEIATGDEIMVAQPVTSVIVPLLSAAVDPDADRITVKGPANAWIEVNIVGSLGRTVATDANGDYVLDLRGQVDVSPGDSIGVQYLTPAGHRIFVAAYAGAMLSAALKTDRVWGYAPYGETEIAVTVKRGGAVIGSDRTTSSGYFVVFPIDATGKPVVLAAGDVLELDFGAGVVKTLTLDALSLAIDVQTDLLSGTGPANRLLGVIAPLPGIYKQISVMTDATGAWSANLAAELLDIRPGNTASVRHSLNGADATWLYGVAPVFWVYNDTNEVNGYAPPYAPVMVTLKRNGGLLAIAGTFANDTGNFWVYLYDLNGLPIRITPGDIIEVKSAQTVTVTVPPMEIALDASARRVSGVGPANSPLGVRTSAGNKTVTSDAAGAWSVDFAAFTNSPLSWANLVYREPHGNWIVAETVQRVGGAASLRARWDPDRYEYSPYTVSGSAGAGPRQVVLSLKRGGLVATASAWSGPDGSFGAVFRNATGDTVDILAGDVIEMVAGDVSKSMTVPALSVAANLESETLFGAGPANTDLYAGGWCNNSTVIDPSGTWVVGCSDLEKGADGYVYVTDLVGNSTYLGWSVPLIAVREHGNEVDGTVALGADVLVQLLRGAAVIAEATDIADSSNGWFSTEFFSAGGSPVIIQPNDLVVNAGAPITVPVVPLSAAIDPATDRVTGAGPANDDLLVRAWAAIASARRIVITAADGSYTADFTAAIDLRAGDQLEVTHRNADGNEVWLGWYTPLVRINLASDIVDGFATPNSTASLVLKRGGATVATAQAQTDMSGQFSAFFRDGSGNVIDLVAGDVVDVTASPTVITAAIALTAGLDPRNDTVSGNAPAGAPLLVLAYTCTTSGCSRVQMTAIANDAGFYLANFSGMMDLGPTSYAYVHAADAAGNLTSVTTTPVEVPRLKAAQDYMESIGAVLLMSAYGTANWGNLTPPKTFNVMGGGRLIFSADMGVLVITAPDGTITRPNSTYYVVENPRTGKWQVQVYIWNGTATQYVVTAGLAQYSIYMPTVRR